METVTLIIPLEATTMNSPSEISGVKSVVRAGATAGVTAAATEQQRSNSTLITKQYRNDTGASAERKQSNSRATAGVTVK